MSMVIPFIHSLNPNDELAWLYELNKYADGCRVQPVNSLNMLNKKQAKVAIVANPNPNDLAVLPNIKWVQSLWAGVDKLVTELPATVGIARLIDPQLAETMAESVLTWVLYLHHRIPEYRQQQMQQQWLPLEIGSPKQRTVAVLGLGQLGLQSALRLHTHGFKVIGWSKHKKTSKLPFVSLDGEKGLQEVLTVADIVVVLLPLTKETTGLFDDNRFAQMKHAASIINFARGQIIQEQALLTALTKNLSHAVLDVFDSEPLPKNHPYWLAEKISVLPHIAAPTNKQTAAKIAMDNIKHYLAHSQTPKLIDRELSY